MSLELAFGIKFIDHLKNGQILDFLLGGIAIPCFAHAWIVTCFAGILNLIKGTFCPIKV